MAIIQGEDSEVHKKIATTAWLFTIIGAMPYVRETSISFFWVCGYNKLIPFNEANFVFADVLHTEYSIPITAYQVQHT